MDNNDITISLVTPGADYLNKKANELSNRLVNMCNQRKIRFINRSDDIQHERHENDRKTYLNRYETIVFAKTLTKLCEIYIDGAMMIVIL